MWQDKVYYFSRYRYVNIFIETRLSNFSSVYIHIPAVVRSLIDPRSTPLLLFVWEIDSVNNPPS